VSGQAQVIDDELRGGHLVVHALDDHTSFSTLNSVVFAMVFTV